jgi:serine/threonine-protein kinase
MPDDDRLEEILERWRAARQAGDDVPLEELCRHAPDLLPALRLLAAQVEHTAAEPANTPLPPFQETKAPDTIAAIGVEGSPALDWETAAGRYQPLKEHAKGGLGEVFLAVDRELNREVALKRIQERFADHPESRRRFLLEAEITGRLEHPGIVPVYGLVHDPSGQPCYAMRFIQGESLQDAVRRFHEVAIDGPAGTRDAKGSSSSPQFDSLEFRQLLQRLVSVCNTIAYAHSRGIIHRDIKPANIMLGKYGETLVVDWGLARSFARGDVEKASGELTLAPAGGSSEGATQMGRAVGTPSYMSPEQAAGRWDKVGPISDVYGLGATLYTVLTGRVPFQGEDQFDILQKVQRGDLPKPRKVRKNLPAPLEAIERYATPQELAADLEHWLADEPVNAYQEPLSAKSWRWIRRHRSLVGAAAVVALIVVVLLAAAAFFLSSARESERLARLEAQSHRDLARENYRLVRSTLDGLVRRTATTRLKTTDLPRVREELLEETLAVYRKRSTRGPATRACSGKRPRSSAALATFAAIRESWTRRPRPTARASS